MHTDQHRQRAQELGERHYLAERPCKHGHVPPLRYTSTGACVACLARSAAVYRTAGSPDTFRLTVDVPEGLSVYQLREWLPELREAASEWLRARMALDAALAAADAASVAQALQRPDVASDLPTGRAGWRGL